MKKCHFSPRVWAEVVAAAEREPRCPRWLAQALPALGRLAPRLPTEEDVEEVRFDMIYPH